MHAVTGRSLKSLFQPFRAEAIFRWKDGGAIRRLNALPI
jgi:hypothetical protein